MELSKKFFLTFLILGAASIQAASLFQKLDSKQQRQWLNLLHYTEGVSENDSDLFYLSERGKINPEEELTKTIELLKKNEVKGYGRFNLSVACAFRSRYEWLHENGFIEKLSFKCEPFEKWKKEINAGDVSVVFSTAYPNNPASMFGHTFLKFHNKNGKGDLLDYATSFEAKILTQDWAPIYAWKGIFGGYPGLYDLKKYYSKVAEYNHAENRDLYIYTLNLNQRQIDFLLMHLWELYNTTYFDYYFTWENCSYQLSRLLDVVLEKNLELPKPWYYLPSDLVKAINKEEGFVKKVTYRASNQKKFQTQLETLNTKEVKELKKHFKEKTLSENRKVLDALIKWNQLEEFKAKGQLSETEKKYQYETLAKRASLGGKSPELKVQKKWNNDPQYAHLQRRLEYKGSIVDTRKYHQIKFQSGYTDLMSYDEGLEPFSEFKFLALSLAYDREEDKFEEGEWTLASVTSLHPIEFYSREVSWSVGLNGIKRYFGNETCEFCSVTRLHALVGTSFYFDNVLVSSLIGARFDYSSRDGVYKENFSPAPEIKIIALSNEEKRLKIKIEFGPQLYFLENPRFNYELDSEISYTFTPNFDLRLRSILESNNKVDVSTLSFSLGVYY
ncbi:MAG: DUF4105 domain-containing protein [Oligoflexia bacterium]|nr:DUF4105 domain-containing protein [Oligoflexia bacterium]